MTDSSQMRAGEVAVGVRREIKVTPALVFAILGPYIYERALAQVSAVLPISLFLFVFQLLVLQQGVVNSVSIAIGLTCVILGLMFFMDGVRLGLMPLGENIGATLPAKAALKAVLGFAFILGVGVTFAEPAISILKTAGSNVRPEDAPLLFEMLNRSSGLLVASVAVGVGIATVLGVYRFVRNWSLRVLLFPTLFVTLCLTLAAALNPATRAVISLAWDTGAVTTGPVTVPLVLALGLGVSATLGESETGMSGFGIVTLASLWPVAIVLLACLGVFYSGNYLPPTDAASFFEATAGDSVGTGPALPELLTSAMQTAAQAIIPLVMLLYVVQRFFLREEVRNIDQVVLGVVFCLFGFALFNLGLLSGLAPLGQQVGSNVPLAFAPPVHLYGEIGGRIVAVAFAFTLGYGATLAEPALNAVGRTVEEVTAGAFKKWLLMHAVAFGVALGLAVGIAKIMFNWPLEFLVLPSYVLLSIVTIFSDEEFVNIGWDSAGVTTGPITVPLVLAMGLGIGQAVGVPEGFGMLALASVGPILTVLVLGLIVSKTGRTREVSIKMPRS